MQQLISNIISYINYLKSACKLRLSVHFDENTLRSMPPQIMEMLLPYNSHTNPYCMAVKRAGHKKCVMSQKEILRDSAGCFLRVCHAGVYEYIHTIRTGDKSGFVAVSGYRHHLPPDSVTDVSLWKTALKKDDVPLDLLNAVIPPLAIMLEQVLGKCMDNHESEYNSILQFLNEYHTNIALSDLCDHFGRSKSHISHMFKSSSGMTIREYCNNLKLEDAKKLLSGTDLSVTEIAFDVGFNDASYFVHLFSKKYAITPLQYRKSSVI